ncbi:uncharacterized protein LOC134532593 [Bacillus rossius redtenbacheri]|uniref:uncharacterized protein LOC134532593 n=1 Tax=Bacillus rossius redtenbacheri TaxID=93214 RepID=UPI002FDF09D3
MERQRCSRDIAGQVEMSLATATTPWLTTDFLAGLLRRAEDDPALTVDGVEVRPASAQGDNYASDLRKVEVDYRDGGGGRRRRSLVVKTPPELPVMRRFVAELRLFQKEVFAYSRLLPALRTLTSCPPVTPAYLPADTPDIVVLEDVSSRGFKMADRKTGLDLAHCRLALRALAAFHGLSAELVRRDPAVIEHLPELVHNTGRRETQMRFIPNTYDSLADIVETWPGYERFAGEIRRRRDTVVEDLERLVVPSEDGFNVVNHGDFWVNNMLFRYSEDAGRPEEVCLIDFQILRYGSPALDLQYFLATSLARGVREDHEDELLASYHEALRASTSTLGAARGVCGLDRLRKDFQDKTLYGFHAACTILCAVVAEPGDAMDLGSLSEESSESDHVDYLTKALRGERFREAFQRMLLFYGKKGFFKSK